MGRSLLKCLALTFLLTVFIAQTSAQENNTLGYHLVWKFEHDQRIQLVEWHPQSDVLAVATQNYVIILKSRDGEEVQRIQIDEVEHVVDMAWNSEGNLLAVGDTLGWVHIYGDQWKELETFFAPWLSALEWHPSRDELVTVNDTETSTHAYSRRQITVWNTEGEILDTVKGLHNVVDVEYSPDGKILASIESGINGALWDGKTYRAITPIYLDTHPRTLSDQHFAQSITWSPDSDSIALLSNNNTEGIFSVVIWDVGTEQIAAEFLGDKSFVNSISWNPQFDLLASAWSDNMIRIWDVEASEEVLTIADHENIVMSVAWGPNGQFLASAGSDRTLRLWEIGLSAE